MAVFYINTTDTSYRWVDIGFGVFCVNLTLWSIVFNGLVFSYNITLNTVTSRLYVLLSSCDFLTLLIYPVLMAIHFFSLSPHRIVHIYLLLPAYTLIMLTASYGQMLVSLMCVCRLIGIKYPLRHVSKPKIYASLGFFAVYAGITAGSSLMSANPAHPFWSQKRQIFDYSGWRCTRDSEMSEDATEYGQNFFKYYLIAKTTYIISVLINFITSITSVYVLMTTKCSNTSSSANLRRSAVTLFILNLGCFVFGIYVILISILFLEGDDSVCSHTATQNVLVIITFPFSVITLSLLNPVVVVTRGSDIQAWARKRLASKFGGCARSVSGGNVVARTLFQRNPNGRKKSDN